MTTKRFKKKRKRKKRKKKIIKKVFKKKRESRFCEGWGKEFGNGERKIVQAKKVSIRKGGFVLSFSPSPISKSHPKKISKPPRQSQ